MFNGKINGFPNVSGLIVRTFNIDIKWRSPKTDNCVFNDENVIALLEQNTLTIRDDLSHTVCRFALAHCYGCLESKVEIPRRIIRSHFSKNTFDSTAKLANVIALETLIPEKLIRLITDRSDCNFEQMAHLFQVSELAMYERLKQLNIIGDI